uniref:Importin N-terminal domain-containing protein n=1 Tax=Panagrellus redivivus TaxID=6233 RepID=A0A7E4VPR8_PANRE
MTLVDNDFCEVVQAVRTILDSATLNQERKRCTEKIEGLKEGDPSVSIPIAFKLITQNDLDVSHVGWNIIEHVIRYKWSTMDPTIRVTIRNGVLQCMSDGRYSLSNSDLPVKTAMSRNLVAMMEQEWPQNWPELFNQFRSIVLDPNCFQQAQMVFIVLKRLVENVITFGTISDSQRRRDLSTSVNQMMPDLLAMTIQRIRMCIESGHNDQSVLVARSAIELLSESVDWVVGRVLEETVDSLIEVLCSYLQVAEHGIYEHAATCLWKIASRKRAKTDETPIVVSMFKDAPMRAILNAASLAAEVSAGSPDHYKYLKALCDLLTALGVHLSEVWGHIKNPPPNFSMYLEAIGSFFVHPSMCIRSEVSQVFVTFANHEKISQSPEFMACVKHVVANIPKNIEKIGSLTDNASLTSHYARMDYEDDVEFQRDFMQLRDRVCRFIRESATRHLDLYVDQLNEWVTRVVNNADTISTTEWESLKRYVMTFVTAAYQFGLVNDRVDQVFTYLFNSLMTRLAVLNSPETMNLMLSIPSSFLQLFDRHTELLPIFFDQLKRILMISSDAVEIVSLKRHAISLMLKVSSSTPNTIQGFAPSILQIVTEAAPFVSVMQRANLVQVLGALSNLVQVEQRTFFLQSAIQTNIDFFLSQRCAEILRSTADLMAFIGLTSQPDVTEYPESQHYLNRLDLKAHLCALDGILQSVNTPEGQSNALFQLLAPVIPSFFQLAHLLNSLHHPANVALIHPGFGPGVLDISAADRHTIYCAVMEAESSDSNDSGGTIKAVNPIHRLQRYISDVTDMIQSITGLCGSKLYVDFYRQPSVTEMLNALLVDADVILDYRMRYWLRRSWKPLIRSCPPDQYAAIMPFAAGVMSHMHQRFQARWASIDDVDYDAEPTKEEIFLEHMTCILSREYTGFLKTLMMGDFNLSKDDNRKQPREIIDPQGVALLSDRFIFSSVVASLCILINCKDTHTALRATPIARVVFGTTFEVFDDNMATHVLVNIIQSLQVHGADEVALGPLLSLIFQIYTQLRPSHPILIEILQQVPETTPDSVGQFDERILGMARTEKVVEKNRRDVMRKMLRPLIAKNIGEQHKRPSHLRVLQPLIRNPKCNSENGSGNDISFDGLFKSS